MTLWATVLALVVAALVWLSGATLASIASGALELGGVIVLFVLVCAAEAFN